MTALGKYELLESLGRGGYGTVYHARDTILDVDRAVKVLHPQLAADPDFIERFRREARTAARLKHPNIVQVYDLDEANGRYFLAMEYLPGRSLKDVLEKHGRLPFERALEIIRQVASALDYAHRQGLIHRDVKPGNILFEADGAAKLADFGFARALSGSSSVSMSVSGGIAGTPAYMPPEIWDAKGATPATDVYSLACVFYEMITGKVLFEGETPSAVMKRHFDPLVLSKQLLQGVPPGVRAVLHKALAKEPSERYTSCGEFAAALGKVTFLSSPIFVPQGSDAEKVTIERKRGEGKRASALPAWASWAAIGALGLVGLVVLILIGILIAAAYKASPAPTPTQMPVVSEYIRSPVPTDAPQPTLTPIPTDTPQPTLTPVPTDTPTPTSPPNEPSACTAIGQTWTSPVDGMTLSCVPAGEFWMGSADSDSQAHDDEKPRHKVYLDAFWIDRTEVTNAMFASFVQATGYQTDAEKQGSGYAFTLSIQDWGEQTNGADWRRPQGPSSDIQGLEDHPVVQISWNDANAYCGWAGRKLPSEAQWEKAARGADGRIYPWGSQPVAGNLLNFADANLAISLADKGIDDGYQFTAPVGSYPAGASPYGVLDMAGNVWEWVADWYDAGYYAVSPASNPTGPSSGNYRVPRGGSWSSVARVVRAALRPSSDPYYRSDTNGFRCAQ